MTEASRGPVLTTFAVLFAILALSNFLKPFHLDPNAGFVFFGMKTHGIANALLGPAFGALLVAYAIGIWRMRRWVLPIAYAYAVYVILNLMLYTISEHRIDRAIVARFHAGIYCSSHCVSTGSAVLLHRRKYELV